MKTPSCCPRLQIPQISIHLIPICGICWTNKFYPCQILSQPTWDTFGGLEEFMSLRVLQAEDQQHKQVVIIFWLIYVCQHNYLFSDYWKKS